MAELIDGVSVVVPTYQGAGHIERCLASLAAQTTPFGRFEVVLVLNGPADGTADVVSRFQAAHPDVRIRTVRTARRGVAIATNAGLAAARHAYATLVDDDDRVSPQYLAALLSVAAPGAVGVAQIADVDADGRGAPEFDNYVNRATLSWAGKRTDVSSCPSVVSFNVAKIVPTPIARAVLVDPMLRSGTDVVYWSELFARFPLEVRVLPVDEHAVYYRSVRAGSHSRPSELSYDFGVVQRLDVVERLSSLVSGPERAGSDLVRRTIRAQVGHMRAYLEAHPEESERALADIRARSLADFPYATLNQGRAKELVVAHAFVPSTDTSAIVTARRVRARREIVDVVAAEPLPGRVDDHGSSALIAREYVDREIVVPGVASWGNWRLISSFCSRGMTRIEALEERKGVHRRVYSRAMWPASHFLAALYKVRRPDVPWVAEFSDPVLHDIQGADRTAPIRDDAVLEELRAGLRAAGKPVLESGNLYGWIEHLAYALADELVFTNESQRAYMREYADPAFHEAIDRRSVVEPHPTLESYFYGLVPTDYEVDEAVVNLAYFGVFYVTRGLTELVSSLRGLAPDRRRRVRLHLFTRPSDELLADLRSTGLDDVVVVNDYVPYLEFLTLTTKFDALVVNDTRTAGTHSSNPYMPSKWSDYRGSGRPIWALVEPGSVLSSRPNDFASELGDAAAAAAILEKLIDDKFGDAGQPKRPEM